MNAAAGQMSAPPTRGTAWKIVASVIAVTGAVSALIYASAVPDMAHYKHVDEVMAKIDQWRGKRLKVHGHVVEGSILVDRKALQYKFRLEARAPRTPAVISVEYQGIVPDNFKNGAEVVAKGTLTPDNRLVVQPDGIEAKCPSKYEGQQEKLGMPTGAAPAKPSPVAASK